MKKTITLVLCLSMLLTLLVSCGGTQPEESNDISQQVSEEESKVEYNTDYSNFEPVVRFAVASDVHFAAYSNYKYLSERFATMMSKTYEYAEGQSYKKLDALLFAGDMTADIASIGHWQEYKKAIETNVKADQTQVITVMGNHEYYTWKQIDGAYDFTVDNNGIELYKQYTGEELNKDIVINGIHVIGISPTEFAPGNKTEVEVYSAETKKFLEDALANAVAEAPEKPIIVMHHHNIGGTVYLSGSGTSDSSWFKGLLAKYPQVIDFSGHSHAPLNIPTSIYQNGYTALGTSTLYYGCLDWAEGFTFAEGTPDNLPLSQFYIVEVDAENRVRIMPYDVLAEDFAVVPSTGDGEPEQLIYYIDKPSDKNANRYNQTVLKSEATAPKFESDKVETTFADGKLSITIPQASDEQCIYYYIISFTEEGKTSPALTKKCAAEFYKHDIPDTQTYVIEGLNASTKYDVKIIPVNCYSIKGEAITANITTE